MKRGLYLISILILVANTCIFAQDPEETIFVNDQCIAILPDYSNSVIAFDNCTDVVVSQIPEPGIVLTPSETPYNIEITAEDAYQNKSTITLNLYVLDTIGPIIQPIDTPDIEDAVIIEAIDTVVTSRAGYDASSTTEKVIVFRNNRVQSSLEGGFMLQIGQDNYYDIYANKRDYSQVIGNYFLWNGTEAGVHCIMAGYNEHYNIRYNFIDGPTYGLVHEGGYPGGESMIGGDICYNIFKDTKYAMPEKGYDGSRIYNNIFCTTVEFSYSYQLSIKASDTGGSGLPEPYPESKNTDVKNNIFYASGNTIAISLETAEGFTCDYNIYYWESTTNHEPIFRVDGRGVSWDEWRAMGYDTHSVILDPEFNEKMVPAQKLDMGTNLGEDYIEGIAPGAEWVIGAFIDTNRQSGTWQIGAYVYQ
jgi:hypothetical protein